jgi:integrase
MLVQKSPFIVVAEPNTKPHFKIVNRTGRADKDVLSFLLDLLASDRSPETIKSYAFGLCAWFNFLHSRTKSWQTARSQDLRDYVLHLRDANNPYRVRRRPNSPEPGSANLQTGKPSLGPGYKLSTINHRLSVIQSFYDFQHHAGTIASDIVRLDRPRIGHHNPLEPWPLRRRGPYRQRTQKRVPRGLSDALWDNIFDNLQCDRDRAILCLLTSSGSRAQELLNMKGADIDWGGQRVQLICKGTRQENWVGASPEFFRWLAAYLTKRSQLTAKSPLWVTLRKPERSMKYTALRAIFTRINHKIGTNVTAHDFRHTCALRLAADPKISLVDIQTHLRHRHITTTERYLVAHPDEVIKRLQAHQAKKPLPKISNNTWKYDSADLGLLLGKEGANQ